MRDLRLDLDTTDFDQLFTLGRSLIATECPVWTDWNTHDPGIMLIELLAWIADAQTYSLARLRRDERSAYARLLGALPGPPGYASGLIWPKALRLPPPDATLTISTDARIVADSAAGAAMPIFHVSRPITLTPASLDRLVSYFADGEQRDWTRVNEASAASFRPFETPCGSTAALSLECSGLLIDSSLQRATVSIGLLIVRTPAPGVAPGAYGAPDQNTPCSACPQVTLIDGSHRVALVVESDSTRGLLQSGTLLIEIDRAQTPRNPHWTLVIEPADDAQLITPSVLHVAFNVLPVQQIGTKETFFDGTGLPGQTCTLDRGTAGASGASADSDDPSNGDIVAPHPHAISMDDVTPGAIPDADANKQWSARNDISRSGPDERVFLFDPVEGELRFGNGLNGYPPDAGHRFRVRYLITRGPLGNLNPGRVWRVQGASGFIGTNPEPMTGGRLRPSDEDLQWTARRHRLYARPIVTSDDLTAAALALPGLGVARVSETPDTLRGRNERRLIAMHSEFVAAPSGDPEAATPTEAWLDTLRRALASRLVLGQHLTVVPPRFVQIEVHAELIAQPGADPADIRAAAAACLRAALQPLRQRADDAPPWPFGQPLALLTIKAWLRKVPGVMALVRADIRRTGEAPGDVIAMGPRDLPWLASNESSIVVRRPNEEA
jgi:hypothetical protein